MVKDPSILIVIGIFELTGGVLLKSRSLYKLSLISQQEFLGILPAGASFTSRALFSKKRRKNLTYAILRDRSERRTVEALEIPSFNPPYTSPFPVSGPRPGKLLRELFYYTESFSF